MTVGELYTIYCTILQNPSSHSFIGMFDSKAVCQVDLYLISIDEVSKHVVVKPDDCGMHFLMAPVKDPIKGLSQLMFNAFLLFFFSHDEAQRMYGEPDMNNAKANRLVLQAGFKFIKHIKMSYKEANLYVLTREKFQQQFDESMEAPG